jgi:hypothetical protein
MAAIVYTVDATREEVAAWYERELRRMGYAEGGGRQYANEGQGYERMYMTFGSHEMPTTFVQLDMYSRPGVADTPTEYDILVHHQVPPARTEGQHVPDGVTRVDVTYVSGGLDSTTQSKTLADKGAIEDLVTIVNRMPVRPAGLVQSCQILEGPAPSATLVFHKGGTSWTITADRGCELRVKFPPYPDLIDSYDLLWGASRELFGISSGDEGQGSPVIAQAATPGSGS